VPGWNAAAFVYWLTSVITSKWPKRRRLWHCAGARTDTCMPAAICLFERPAAACIVASSSPGGGARMGRDRLDGGSGGSFAQSQVSRRSLLGCRRFSGLAGTAEDALTMLADRGILEPYDRVPDRPGRPVDSGWHPMSLLWSRVGVQCDRAHMERMSAT
jgi:hypothetical protein